MSTSSYRSTEIPESFKIPESFNLDLIHQLALLDGEAAAVAAASIALMGYGSRLLLRDNDPALIEMDEQELGIDITAEGWKTIEECLRFLVETEGPDWADRYFEERTGDEPFEKKVKRALDTANSPQQRHLLKRLASASPLRSR